MARHCAPSLQYFAPTTPVSGIEAILQVAWFENVERARRAVLQRRPTELALRRWKFSRRDVAISRRFVRPTPVHREARRDLKALNRYLAVWGDGDQIHFYECSDAGCVRCRNAVERFERVGVLTMEAAHVA